MYKVLRHRVLRRIMDLFLLAVNTNFLAYYLKLLSYWLSWLPLYPFPYVYVAIFSLIYLTVIINSNICCKFKRFQSLVSCETFPIYDSAQASDILFKRCHSFTTHKLLTTILSKLFSLRSPSLLR